ncbi:phytoene/squalene synthase family protein [Sphingomonas piscis]|uniref:Phytoene/squalene synthase family protein n=1 Tax=Sphingomonas piscis TaxID=2714943 RepID=A0A6G7YSD7_9SPHN|nr:phytoene/squalene synthase family protein [Sphingomonas piscis]QIK79656.1 phytoene/squalene synthase family protein [Sphingomonas piscis]
MTRDEIVAGAFDAIQRGSKSFRASSRLFDRETRERAWLLYSWCRHCDDQCDGQVMGQGSVERGSVADLRDKTARVVRGESVAELPFEALALLLSERPVPQRLLDDHLQGFELDAAGWQPKTHHDLIRYCYHVAGSVGCMMAIVMGVPADDQATLERASDLGIAFQLSNIARDVREDHLNGRCYLPSDWLAEFGIPQAELFAPEHRAGLLAMVDRLVGLVDLYEARSRSGVNRLPFRSRLAVLAAARIYGAIGRRVGSLGEAAWDERVTIGRARKLGFLVPSLAEAVVRRRP